MTRYQQAFALIKGAKKVLLAGHINPDGDAWSSISALCIVLSRLGIDWQVYLPEVPNKKFTFIDLSGKTIGDSAAIDWPAFDLLISLDCGTVARTGLAAEFDNNRHPGLKFLEIDHHPTVELSGADVSLRVTAYAATCEVIYHLLKDNQVKIDATMANCLLYGIATDTGNLVYAAASSGTMAVVAELLCLGANLAACLSDTWKTKSLPSLRLWGIAMSRLKVNRRYGVAYTFLTQDDFLQTETTENEAEDLAGFLSGNSESKAFLLLKETAGGKIKGSWRSNDSRYDVGKLSRLMGGGGHSRAAGFDLDNQQLFC